MYGLNLDHPLAQYICLHTPPRSSKEREQRCFPCYLFTITFPVSFEVFFLFFTSGFTFRLGSIITLLGCGASYSVIFYFEQPFGLLQGEHHCRKEKSCYHELLAKRLEIQRELTTPDVCRMFLHPIPYLNYVITKNACRPVYEHSSLE